MPISAAIGAAGALGSAAIGYFGSQNASNAQADSSRAALAQQNTLAQQGLSTLLSMFNQAKTGIQPVLDAGGNILGRGNDIVSSVLPTLTNLLTPGPNQTSTLSQLPGFQFAQDWGQKAITNQATASGLGGNALKAGADYATGAASQSFGSLTQMLQALLGSGTGLIGTGANTLAQGGNSLAQAATSTGSSAFTNLTQVGQNTGNTIQNIGNAQASGILGGANALSGGLSGASNAATNALLLNKVLGNSSNSGTINSAGNGIYSGVQNYNPNALGALN